MNRDHVDSTLIESIGYDASTSTLEVEFKNKGAVWQYYDVPENIYYELKSGSVGKYFLANIKGHYTESQIG